jgi:hypothetical protein
MPTAFNLRKLLHRKAWERSNPSTVNTLAGSFMVSDKFNVVPNSPAYFVAGASAIYRYEGDDDGPWQQLPNSGITGTFGAGACGEYRGLGAMGGVFNQTVTAGGVATLTTNKTIVRSLAGRRLRVIAGTGAGFDGTVLSNTIGTNSVITTSGSTTFDATTVFQVFSGSLWYFNPGAGAVGFSVYDPATNAWTARSVTGLPTTFATDGQLVSTMGSTGTFFGGTASAGGASTLTGQAGVAWATNQWRDAYQVRITSGTGAGQIRAIASNTGTVITTASAWTVNPDATSVYVIEGNDDAFYLMGNAAVTLYKYIVSTNTWSTLAPGAARGGVAGAGASLSWIDNVSTWTLNGTTGAASALVQGGSVMRQNGRYLFSFRGGGAATLDIYDIAGNTWISDVAYGNRLETFTTGTSSVDFDGVIYLQKEATGRIFKFNVSEFALQPFTTVTDPQGAAVTGQKMFMLPYVDGGTKIPFLYTQAHTQSTLSRMIVI